MSKKLVYAKRSTVSILSLMLVMVSQWWLTAPAEARVDKAFGEPVSIGSPIENVAVFDATFGKEDGRDVMYTTVTGKPAIFQVVDLVSKEVLRKYRLEGTESSWTHITLPDGTVYVGGNGKLYTYSPATKELRDLGGIGESVVYGLTYDEQGRVYFGSYPNAKVGRYDPSTGEMKDYGNVMPGQSYTRATAYHNGYLYAGIGIQGSLVKVDVDTGEKEQIPLPTYGGAVQTAQVYQLDAAGKYIVAGLSGGNNALLFYDTEAGDWSDTYFLDNKGIRLSAGEPGSNKVYFVQNNRLMELDLITMDAVDTGIEYSTYLRNTAWVEMPNDPELPGKSLATIMWSGAVAYMNLETKKVKSVTYPFSGNPIPIQTLEKGPDGKLYMSGYPGGKGAAYSPISGEIETFSLGQAEGMAALGDKMYFGIYPGGYIWELDVNQPIQGGINPKEIYKIPHQDRPFAMTPGEGKLFIGTIPDYGELGGSLTVYDPSLGPENGFTVYEDVVHNQSIVSLAVRDGKLYGSTTVAGGLGIDPTETAAKIFVWDIASGRKLQEFVPAIPGASIQPAMISGLSFGPDGLLWAAADGLIFAMDPETMGIVKSANIYPSVSNYGRWRPVHIRWSEDGYMVTTLAGRITVIDPNDPESAISLSSTQLMTLGEDGNIYYADDTLLKKIEVTKGNGAIHIPIELPLVNGSFDQPADNGVIPGWSSLFNITPNVSFGLSNEQTVSGPNSLKITDTSTTETVAVASDSVPVKPGTAYSARFQVYLQEGRTLASLNYYDANHKQVGGTSLQITAGGGKWQQLEMNAVAPDNAAYVRLVFFCSQLWTTKAYYDDASITYMETVTPDQLPELIESRIDQGEIQHPLAKQLSNSIRQAQLHYGEDRIEQAVHQLENALKHLDRSGDRDIQEGTRIYIQSVIRAFIQSWS